VCNEDYTTGSIIQLDNWRKKLLFGGSKKSLELEPQWLKLIAPPEWLGSSEGLTVPGFWLRHNLGHCQESARQLNAGFGSTQFPGKPKPKPQHIKIKVGKEREKNRRLIFKDLKQCVRKPEGRPKHQRIISSCS